MQSILKQKIGPGLIFLTELSSFFLHQEISQIYFANDWRVGLRMIHAESPGCLWALILWPTIIHEVYIRVVSYPMLSIRYFFGKRCQSIQDPSSRSYLRQLSFSFFFFVILRSMKFFFYVNFILIDKINKKFFSGGCY